MGQAMALAHPMQAQTNSNSTPQTTTNTVLQPKLPVSSPACHKADEQDASSGYRNSMQGARTSGRSTPLAGYAEPYRMDGKIGWLAAFGTVTYPDGTPAVTAVLIGEPPLLEELGVNFGHIKTKVSS
jgi:hypothetical protein